jgi:hypothetical protein
MQKHTSKIVVLVVVLVIFGIWTSFNSIQQDAVNVPDASDNKPTSSSAPQSAIGLVPANKSTRLGQPISPVPVAPNTHAKPKVLTGNAHFDQMSPSMQKALKDSLLLEGPKKSYTRADGTVVLPSNGRFTQMPVAVQMPDGTIKIQEYSNIPKPVLTVSPPK